jgi:predicted lipoprotein with Yx(FWY)xxD motif
VLRIVQLFVMLAIAAAVVAGCGGESHEEEVSRINRAEEEKFAKELPPRSENEAPPALLQVGTSAGLGKVLVDSAGKTVYYFDKDKRGSGKTHCYGACIRLWFIVRTNKEPDAIYGARPSLLGTIMRKDGVRQATYNGWPLYTYIGERSLKSVGADKKSFGGTWHALRPNGESAG